MLRRSQYLPGLLAAPVWFTKLFKFKIKVLEFAGGTFAASISDPVGTLPGNGSTIWRAGATVSFQPDDEINESVITAVRYCNFTTPDQPVQPGSLGNTASDIYSIDGQPYYPTGVNNDNAANVFFAGDYAPTANTNNQVMLNLCDGDKQFILKDMPVTALSWFNGLATYAPFNTPANCPLLNVPSLPTTNKYIRTTGSPPPSSLSIANSFNKYNRNRQFCLNGIALENSFIQVTNIPQLESGTAVGNYYLANLNGTAMYFGFEFMPRAEWNKAVKELGLTDYVFK